MTSTSIMHPKLTGLHFGTGKYGIGKTTWALTVEAPDLTVLVDMDLGKGRFYESLGIKYFTPPVNVAKQTGDGILLDMQAIAHWFFREVLPVAEGTHLVIDNVSPLEQAFGTAVSKDPASFGINVANVAAGRYGGVNPGVSNIWYAVIASLMQKFRLVTVTSHVGNPWINGAPVLNKYNAKGNSQLMRLANFAVAITNGETPASRAGVVLKSAYADLAFNGEGYDPRPLIPPRIPILDWKHINDYLNNPRDFSNLNADEIPSRAEIEMWGAEYTPEQLELVRSFTSYSETGEEEGKKNQAPPSTVVRNEDNLRDIMRASFAGKTGLEARQALSSVFNGFNREEKKLMSSLMNEFLTGLK